MIIGTGVDVVDVPRFQAALLRTPGLADRLFSDKERAQRTKGSGETDGPLPDGAVSLAGRFAAKEAAAKALGAPGGLRWHDCEVLTGEKGRPYLHVTGTVAAEAQRQGIVHWHLSLSHDGGVAVAFVIAESS